MWGNTKRINVAIVMILVGLSAGPALALGTPAADAGSDGRVDARQELGCNYAQLYDETIQSVVQVRTAHGLGSGFVYETFSGNGTSYVVTNQHVINGSEIVQIRFSRGETRLARVVGTDVYSDLAVVQVNRTPDYVSALPVSDRSPDPGQPVAALGSPFGLEGTITHGIVSGVNRTMPTTNGFTIPNTIQTDAPINPGNSGGPLVTCNRTVIGVNRAGGGENIGFAISASLLEEVVPALIRTGEYHHSFLGIRGVTLTAPLVRANDLAPTTEGVYVLRVVDDGPASGVLQGATGIERVAGVRVPVGGDVIVAIDGHSVESRGDLLGYLATQTNPGERVRLTIIRNGERRTVTVTLGRRPPPR